MKMKVAACSASWLDFQKVGVKQQRGAGVLINRSTWEKNTMESQTARARDPLLCPK